MEIRDSKNINAGEINTQGGDVHIGDKVIVQSVEYQNITKSIARLEKLLSLSEDDAERLEFSEELNQEKEKLRQFKFNVLQLAETFQKIDIDTDRLKRAKAHFDKGEFQAARAVLDAEQMGKDQATLLSKKERLSIQTEETDKLLRHNSDEYLVLAQTVAVDFSITDRFQKTIEYYDLSLKANRNIDNIFSYARFLQQHNQNNIATPLYEESLSICRKLAEQYPSRYLSRVATTLNNLAILQSAENNYAEAEGTYTESLLIRRKLAEQHPDRYLPKVASTLNNLAVLQNDKTDYDKAEGSYKEALSIQRKLAEEHPELYLGYLASTLDNLGNLYFDKTDYDKAERSHEEALWIQRKLAEQHPDRYLPDVASTLNNLGNLQRAKTDYAAAEDSYVESLSIRRELAKKNPEMYLLDVALTLNNLGNLQIDKNNYAKAEDSYVESLSIRREFTKKNPVTYLPELALTLHNLGNLQWVKNDYAAAEDSYAESLSIRRELAKKNPEAHLPDMALILNNLGNLQRDKNDYEQSEVNYLAALEIRIVFAEQIPQVYEIPLADTYICLSQMYRYNLSNPILSKDYANKAVALYSKYWGHVPHAKKWGEVAQDNLGDWEEE